MATSRAREANYGSSDDPVELFVHAMLAMGLLDTILGTGVHNTLTDAGDIIVHLVALKTPAAVVSCHWIGNGRPIGSSKMQSIIMCS